MCYLQAPGGSSGRFIHTQLGRPYVIVLFDDFNGVAAENEVVMILIFL